MANTFVRWTTEGQLLTVVFGLTVAMCLYFWIFVEPVEWPSILNEVLLAVLAAWLTNMGYGMKKNLDRKAESPPIEDTGGRHSAK